MNYFDTLPNELVLHIFSKFRLLKDLKNTSISKYYFEFESNTYKK